VLEELGRDRGVAAVVLANHTAELLGALPAGLVRRTAAIGVADERVPGFDVDSPSGVRGLLRHLHAGGRRRVALVAGPPWVAAATGPLEAYRAFVRAAGLPVRAVGGDFSAEGGRAGAARVLRRWPDTDAVIALSDAAALGVVQELAERGVGVPDDVAVAGFDDVPLAALARPGLTTATHPVEAIAAAAAGAALAGAAPGAGPHLFASQVVLRRTA